MRYAVWLVPALLAITFFVTAPAAAKPEYTRRTSKECSFCHMPPGYNLNDAGKYYQEHQHSLKGYVPAAKPRTSTLLKNAP
jgi:hypothetical protein